MGRMEGRWVALWGGRLVDRLGARMVDRLGALLEDRLEASWWTGWSGAGLTWLLIFNGGRFGLFLWLFNGTHIAKSVA